MALERDGAEALLTAALAQLQRRLSAPPSAAPRKLYEELRVLLTRAIRAQVLQNGMYAVKQLLRLTPDPERRARCWVLTGGPLDFGRTADAALETHFIRADGGVVHFHLTLRETDTGEVDVLAYG
ncbi:MAG TPA: hypothetical protein VFK02_24585, partial [Kofleriaceae bacterium]|nr:hypothetical protein [Kofleriaceae bacterium]